MILLHYLVFFGEAPPGKLAGALYNVWIENSFQSQRKYFPDHADYFPITFKIR